MEEKSKEQLTIKVHALRAQAVRMAMVEVLGEQREEILKRAKAKLMAQGLSTEQIDEQALQETV